MGLRVRCSVRYRSKMPALRKKIESRKIRILFRQAGYLRKTARNKIKKGSKPTKKGRAEYARYGKEISVPGEPPRWHGQGQGIKRTISFAVDRGRGVAVIGYERGKNPTIPAALERGGTSKTKHGRQRVRARPVMGPSLRSSRRAFRSITRDEFKKIWR